MVLNKRLLWGFFAIGFHTIAWLAFWFFELEEGVMVFWPPVLLFLVLFISFSWAFIFGSFIPLLVEMFIEQET